MLKAVRAALIVILNIIFYGLAVFGGVQLVHVAYDFAYETLADTSVDLPPGRDEEVTVEASQSEMEVASMLAEENLVSNKYSFYLRMQLQKEQDSALQPGTYTLNSSMNYEEIIQEIMQSKKAT